MPGDAPGVLFHACAAAALLSVLVMNFFEIRTNRTATGTGVTLLSAGAGWSLILAGLVIAAYTVYVLRRYVLARAAGFLILVSMVPMALATLGLVSSALGRIEAQQARVSIGPGFWLFLAAVYGMIVTFAPAMGSRSGVLMRSAMLAGIAAFAFMLAYGSLDALSLLKEYQNRKSTFLAESLRHFFYAGGSTVAALAIGVPFGYAASRSRAWERPVFFLANMAQAFPTISLLGLLIVPLSMLANRFPALGALGIRGVGWAPASIVLFLYALLPVIANAHAGFRMVEPPVLDAAKGLGMHGWPLFLRVQLPLALPAILGGTRTALTQNLGNAVLAGLIGGGGLGSLIFLGLAQAAPDLILLGVLPLVAMVFMSEQTLGALERIVRKAAGSEGARTC
jgi:osmoprotectant transport system permease protein